MSEHRDPIRQLESFDIGGVPMRLIPPSEVRRLGDRRRARRRAATVLASAAAVVAVVVPLGIGLGHGSEGSARPTTRTHTPSPSPTATVSSGPAGVVTYPGAGLALRTPADAHKLTGTSGAFRSFIGGELVRIGGPSRCAEIRVQKYSPAGYAVGSVSSCGGYAALWVLRDGAWQEGSGTQDVWDCDALRYLAVPTSFAGSCANEAGGFGPDEVSGLRLGMTAAQVEATGSWLDGAPSDSCRGLVLPQGAPVPNQVDGYFSAKQNLVAVFARPGMKTPERIGLGSSRAAVEAAYPNATQKPDHWVVPLGHGTEYQIQIDQDGTVHELALARSTQDCFG